MKPIFGPGIVFDLPLEQRKKAIRTRALRDEHMHRHADLIAGETERMCDLLGDEGELGLLEFFGELTTYTSTASLIGQEFRDDLALRSSEFASAFQMRMAVAPHARRRPAFISYALAHVEVHETAEGLDALQRMRRATGS